MHLRLETSFGAIYQSIFDVSHSSGAYLQSIVENSYSGTAHPSR